jgi:hypothetical protein
MALTEEISGLRHPNMWFLDLRDQLASIQLTIIAYDVIKKYQLLVFLIDHHVGSV